MTRPKHYRMLDEEEWFDLLDEQMASSDCGYCHYLALTGHWKTEIKEGQS